MIKNVLKTRKSGNSKGIFVNGKLIDGISYVENLEVDFLCLYRIDTETNTIDKSSLQLVPLIYISDDSLVLILKVLLNSFPKLSGNGLFDTFDQGKFTIEAIEKHELSAVSWEALKEQTSVCSAWLLQRYKEHDAIYKPAYDEDKPADFTLFKQSSYSLKSDAEKETGNYVSNLAMLCAAQILGITIEPTFENSPNGLLRYEFDGMMKARMNYSRIMKSCISS